MKPTKKTAAGFTLIELMIVVAVIGILAGVAYPSYLESVRKSNRADAKVELNDVAQRLQRCFTAYSAYNNDNCGVFGQLKDGGKITSREKMYEITGAVNATTYALTATPDSSGRQAGDAKCTTFTLTHTGLRGATGSAADSCW